MVLVCPAEETTRNPHQPATSHATRRITYCTAAAVEQNRQAVKRDCIPRSRLTVISPRCQPLAELVDRLRYNLADLPAVAEAAPVRFDRLSLRVVAEQDLIFVELAGQLIDLVHEIGRAHV